MQAKKKIVIAGGGTAGWMTAAALSKLLGKNLDITLIESDEIGTVGVGEATIPTLHIYHQLLGLKESDVMAATNATFKLGISFENWRDRKKDYVHSFGFLGQDCWAAQFHHFWVKGHQKGIVEPIGDYCHEHLAAREERFAVYPNQDLNHAYHLDATLYAKFLRTFSERFGVKRIEGKIADVRLRDADGFIESIQMESGSVIEGDLFIDCTGFNGLLIEKALHTGYEDWSHWLPCDRAIAVQTVSNGKLKPYTRSIAHDSGWQWQIPLQTRTGNGMVFCSRYWSDEEAIEKLTQNIDGEMLTKPRVIHFRTGTRRLHWNKNCVAIGLSSGFIEPLESTSIHMIQRNIVRLMLLFPAQGIKQSDIDEFNRQAHEEMEHIRDFIVLHYHVTERRDSKFWRYCAGMKIPASLQHRIDLFRDSARIYKYDKDLFQESSWVQVMMGQGLMPEAYHPIVDLMGDQELNNFLEKIRLKIKQSVADLPMHADFIKQYCPTTMDKQLPATAATLNPQTANVNGNLHSQIATSVYEIGNTKTPVLVANNVSVDGGVALANNAKTLSFGLDGRTLYPGVRANLPDAYVHNLLARLLPAIYGTYKIPPHLKPKITQACYSLVTQPASTLKPMQRLPHFDNTSPYSFAILHYLAKGPHGDTGFFRHNPTRMERVYEVDKEYYLQSATDFLSAHPDHSTDYLTDSNDHYTLYHRIPYESDRVAIYPGNLLHSLVVDSQHDIGWDIEKGRLTANIFVDFE